MTLQTIRVTSPSYMGKVFGLIGKKEPESLLLKTRFGIHTFGVRFPIDVVILDRQNTIVTIKEHVSPNRIFFWNPLFDTVLELPSGSIEQLKLRKGIKLTFIFSQ